MVKIASIIKTFDARPIIQVVTGLVVGRYVSRFPLKVALPITCAAMCADWAVRKTSSPGYLRQFTYLCSAVTASCYAANAFPALAKRIPDIAGLWLCTIAAPTIAASGRDALVAWFGHLATVREAKVRAMQNMQSLFRDHFSNNASLESLKLTKDDLFYNKKLSASCEGVNKSGEKLTINFQIKDGQIHCSVHSEGNKVELSKLEHQMLTAVLIPGRPYFEASLAAAAASLTTEKAKDWMSRGFLQMSLETADGRFWMFWIDKEKGQYCVLQRYPEKLDGQFSIDETVGFWRDQGSRKNAIEIPPELYSTILDAYKRCLEDDPDNYLDAMKTDPV